MNLHGQIMNLPIDLARMPSGLDETQTALYLAGHRDARHAAAELALAHEACFDDLLSALKGAVACMKLQRDVIERGAHRSAWNGPITAGQAAIAKATKEQP